MRTFPGWWLESKNYTNQADVPRSQSPEKVEGAVFIRYDLITSRKEVKQMIEQRKITQVIEVDTRVDIKDRDMVYTDKWLKVDYVDTYIPEDKMSIVRLWPNRKSHVEVKRVYLK